MSILRTLVPKSMEAQMVAIIALALILLFVVLSVLEIAGHESAIETAESAQVRDRLKRLHPMLQRLDTEDLASVLGVLSSCHEGYSITDQPFPTTANSEQLRATLARDLSVAPEQLRVGHARLTVDEFAYRKCRASEIDLPMQGIVISLQLPAGQWLNREVHPHEWHIREKLDWLLRAGAAFAFVGGIAIFFIHRLNKPLNRLTNAAREFGKGLQPFRLEEAGSPDLKQAIRSFNEMQQRVADEVARRTNTLVAISHDIRTPLTALRIKAELLEDGSMRQDLIGSIERMERMTASALEFLKGESSSEPLRSVDLSALLESECLDFEETGRDAMFAGEHKIHYTCRPDALARAVRNLIDNAIKYGGDASVRVHADRHFVEISVTDRGPGIPEDDLERAVEPFGRLSAAREDHQGGFGLGLAIAKAVAEGHGGKLILRANEPRGLVALLRLPCD